MNNNKTATTASVTLWAHTAEDMGTLKNVLKDEFGQQAKIGEAVPHIWLNTGLQDVDTRVGYAPATSSELDDPSVRYIAKAQVPAGPGLSSQLASVAARLPANNEGSFAHGNAVMIAPRRLTLIESEPMTELQQPEAPALAAG